ncbi:MAG: hypothetical protein IJ542_00095 [Clostridia bacterium]|nr:hypothetical protein [Clostridia bacterium]
MAGGNLSKVTYNDFAKVKITSGMFAGDIYWYLSIPDAKVGDKVIVPLGANNTLFEGEILRIDKGVSSQMSPVNPRHAKRIKEIK